MSDDEYLDNFYDEDNPYTGFYMPIAYTAPSSCPTAFTWSTYTEIYFPTEVVRAGLITPVSEESVTSTYGGSTTVYVSAYLEYDSRSLTVDITDDFIYTWYVAYCTDPAEYYGTVTTTTGTATSTRTGSGTSQTGNSDPSEPTRSRFGIDQCDSLMSCGWLTTALIVIAAVLPAIFVLGFLESYFWFRRLMTGKSALRFGTVCWMFLLLPVICLTRRTPARDTNTQGQLREQWKATSFGTALGLWFKYGFRHKYPVEILGEHPAYDNHFPSKEVDVQQQQPIGYGMPAPRHSTAPSQPPLVYYATTAGGGPPGHTQVAPMPPPDGAGGPPYYPQYPPQAAYAPMQQQQRPYRQSRRSGRVPVSTVSSPSPVSEHAEPATDGARGDVSPPAGPSEPVTRPPPPPGQADEAGPSGQSRD
jgi:hypothetical protein